MFNDTKNLIGKWYVLCCWRDITQIKNEEEAQEVLDDKYKIYDTFEEVAELYREEFMEDYKDSGESEITFYPKMYNYYLKK